MTEDVLFTTQWNDLTRRPIMGHRWLSEDEAKQRWDGGYDHTGIVSVIDAEARDQDGNPCPRWAVFGSATSPVRVRFFTAGGSIWRTIDYDEVDDRLWRWICVTFVYPDTESRYERNQAIRVVKEKFRPDRTGTVQFDERDGMLHTAKITDAPVDGFWLDRPAFGDWSNLSNPEYGVPQDVGWAAPV